MKYKIDDLLKNKSAVLFDMDGTLIDSMGLWKSIDIEYLGNAGIELPENLQSEIEGMSFSETAVYFKNRFKFEASVETIMDDWNRMAFKKYSEEVQFKPGALDFLKALKKLGIKTAIASSNSRHLIESAMQHLNALEYFDVIVTACEAGAGKPAPDIYLLAASKLGVSSKQCLVFEDISMGIMAGKSAGMEVVAVEDSYSADQRDKKFELSDYYINDYFDIIGD